MLHQSRGDGSEFDIPVEPVKNCLICESCVFYNLSAIGGFLRDPTLQLDQNPRIFQKHYLKLRRRSRTGVIAQVSGPCEVHRLPCEPHLFEISRSRILVLAGAGSGLSNGERSGSAAREAAAADQCAKREQQG